MGAKKIENELDNCEFITIKEAMKRTTMSRTTVNRHMWSGELKSKKIGGKRLIYLSSFIKMCK